MRINIYNRKDFIIVFLIYSIVLIKSLYASRLGFGLIDEGEYLHIGLRILRGDIPYQDFFSYLPILYDYWNVFAFKLLGVSVFSPRLLSSMIFSFVPILYYLIARRFSSSIIALLVSLCFGFMELSMERLYYHVFTFSSLILYFNFLKNKKKEIGLLAGLLLGISALFRLDVALQLFLGLTIATTLYQVNKGEKWFFISIKQLIILGLGFLIPITGFLYWLLTHSLFERFVQISITTPVEFAAAQNFPFPKPWNILPQSLSSKDIFASYEALFAYLIILIYLYTLRYVSKNWRRTWKKTPELPTFLLIAFFTTPYIFSRPDLGHMIKGGIPAFFIAAFILERFKMRFKNLLLIIPISFIVVGIAQIVWWATFFDTTIQTASGAIRTNSRGIKGTTFVSANTIEKSLKFIKDNTSQGEQILAVPYLSGLYFLSNRPSNAYVGNIYYGYLPDEEKFVEQLKSSNPKVVIYDYSNKPEGYVKSLREYYPKIDRYIIDNFRPVEETSEGWLFMIKK